MVAASAELEQRVSSLEQRTGQLEEHALPDATAAANLAHIDSRAARNHALATHQRVVRLEGKVDAAIVDVRALRVRLEDVARAVRAKAQAPEGAARELTDPAIAGQLVGVARRRVFVTRWSRRLLAAFALGAATYGGYVAAQAVLHAVHIETPGGVP